MPRTEVKTLLENLDRRVGNIEQKLPTLATKAELEPLATKAELERLATKEDLKALATKAEALAIKDEVRQLGTQLQLEMKILFEEQWDRIKGLFDGYRHHDSVLQTHGTRLDDHDRQLGGLDLRVTALERGRPRK
jgi:hypothetical protein